MSNPRLKLVIDTNVFLVSLASNHRYSWIYDALIEDRFDLCVTSEILLEYEEIITQRYSVPSAGSILDGLILLPNIKLIKPHFNWNILKDTDDNKFIDCVISAAADYIISNDKGFRILKTLKFPPVAVLTYLQFEEKYKAQLTS